MAARFRCGFTLCGSRVSVNEILAGTVEKSGKMKSTLETFYKAETPGLPSTPLAVKMAWHLPQSKTFKFIATDKNTFTRCKQNGRCTGCLARAQGNTKDAIIPDCPKTPHWKLKVDFLKRRKKLDD
ncbi:hypothetical protein BaRGS_00026807 [Batillaria attramentaria]|uniref:Uncharacterized protein n=1 Tax=Batillaria attramentaria TaxID=370345 RepID=A0ABD0K426_9CAEN